MHDLGNIAYQDRVDVLLLQEPWFYQDTICALPGPMRQFVSVGGRAAVIVVGEDIEAVLVCRSKWGVCVWLDAGCGGVYVASVYMQLRRAVRGALDYMTEILGICGTDKILIAIDANACSDLWHSKPSGRTRDNVERAEELEDWICERAMEILNVPTEAYTFSGGHGQSDIDLTLAKGWRDGEIEWTLREDKGVSDHNPIYLRISELCRRDENRVESRCWFLAEARWANLVTSLQEDAENLGFGPFFGMTAEEKVRQMDEWLTRACNEGLRKRDASRKRSVVWWSEELEREKRKVRRLRKKYQRARAALDGRREDVQEAWDSYKAGLDAYKRMLADSKRQDWRNYVTNEGNRDPWGGVTRILRSGRAGRGLASLKVGDGYTRTWKESVNVLLREFFPGDPDVAWRDEQQNRREEEEWDEFSWDELAVAVARMGNKKAPGLDGFRNEVIRATWGTLPHFVKEMFDGCLRESCFPEVWKEAKVVALLKAVDKDPTVPRSYRPVSLLNGWSKVLERMMVNRLMQVMAGHWNDGQYGFMEGKSTEDVWWKIREFRDGSNHVYVGGVFVDFKGAFDNLKWGQIISKIREKGINHGNLGIWADYFKDTNVCMLSESGECVWQNVERGCPQGSVGGPIIWNLCMDELLWLLQEPGIGFAAFADDLTLLVEANTREQLVQRIKEEMAAVFDWGEKYGVQVSGEKTMVMLLKGDLSFGRDPDIRIRREDATAMLSMPACVCVRRCQQQRCRFWLGLYRGT
ncbi:hypothetical protein TKK_0011663 [Trichogramma kaykai]